MAMLHVAVAGVAVAVAASAFDGVAAIAAASPAAAVVHGRNILYMLNDGRRGVLCVCFPGECWILVDRKLDKLASVQRKCMKCAWNALCVPVSACAGPVCASV